MLERILIFIAQKIIELAIEKILEIIWTDNNQRRITNFFKLKILVLYLKLILRKNSFR